MFTQVQKDNLVTDARNLLWKLNRNRSRAKQNKKSTASKLAQFDRLIEKANKRLERRRNLPITTAPEPAANMRQYKIKN